MSKKLYRSAKDRMLGGVAAGIAEYFDIDPTIIRVLFVVTLFIGGTGILAYILLWILVPEEPVQFSGAGSTGEKSEDTLNENFDSQAYYASIEKQREKRRVVAGVILLVLGFIFLADNFIPRIRIGEFWPVILIIAGIAILLNSKK